jgi:hypothetical protein
MLQLLERQAPQRHKELPDATHALKRVGSDLRALESDRRVDGVDFVWQGVAHNVNAALYVDLLRILNRDDHDGAIGPLLVHARILSEAALRRCNRVQSMDPRVQRKYLGSDGVLLGMLNRLLAKRPDLRARYAGMKIFLEEFAPGLEVLTSGTTISAALLAPNGVVGAKLARSRAFLNGARFKGPLQADLVSLFDFWITKVPKVFEEATAKLRQRVGDDAPQQFELRTVPWRWTQDWCERVHGIFRSSAGSTDTPTIKGIAGTVLRVNTTSSSSRSGEVRKRRHVEARALNEIKRKFKKSTQDIVKERQERQGRQ